MLEAGRFDPERSDDFGRNYWTASAGTSGRVGRNAHGRVPALGKMFPEGLEFSWDDDSWAGLRGGTDKPWGAVVALYEKMDETKGILPEPGQVTVGGLE